MHQASCIVSWVAAVLLAGGALAFDPGGWQVFGPLKWAVITVCALAAATSALLRGVVLHRPSAIGWGVFLAWAAFASMFAADPVAAWLGTPDRRFGFTALTTLACAFVGGQAVVDEIGRRRLARAAVVALGGMCLYGATEVLEIAPVTLAPTTSRLGATFGSPAYLGAALCLLVPMAAGVAADRRQPARWRVAAAAATAAGIFLLAGSGTRAAAIGLVVSSALLLWGRSGVVRPMVAGTVALATVVVIVLSPLGARITEPATGRLAEWRIASRVLVSSPVIGVGLEGYRIVFPIHVDTEYVQDYGRDTVTDRAHSGPLDLGVALGIPGTAAWLVAAAWLAVRGVRAAIGGDRVLAGMGAGVVAVLAQELFLFPTLEVGAATWAVAGALVASAPSGQVVRARSAIGAAALACLLVVAAVAGPMDIVADHRATRAATRGDLAAADDALAMRPDSFRYALLGADVAFRRGDLAGAEQRVAAAAARAPRDPAVRVARARVASASGDITRALPMLEKAVGEDPNHPELRILLGDVQAMAGRSGEAERSWLAAAHLAPRDPTPHLRLCALYLAAGEIDLARHSLETARRLDPDHAALPELEDALRRPA